MGQIVPSKDRYSNFRGLLAKNMPKIERGIPASLKAMRVEAIVLSEIRNSAALLECDQSSLLGAIAQSLQLGLVPGLMGQAYLVPYKNKATLIVGYRGYVEMARRSGVISKIEAHLVYRREVEEGRFKVVLGTDPAIVHEPFDDYDPGPVTAKNASELVAYVYAVAFFKDGTRQFDYMSISEIEAIRNTSKMSGSGPWADFYGEMAKKTVIRRLFKLLPIGADLDMATKLDDAADSGKQDFSDAIDAEVREVEPEKSTLQKATDRLKAKQKPPEMTPEEIEEIHRREMEEAGQ